MNQIRRSLAVGSGIFLVLLVVRTGLAGDPLVDVTRKIAAEATTNGKAYANLRELTTVGPRLSGSEGAAKGIEWAKRKLESYGFDHVALQPVMVPHWTRGDVEQASVTSTPHPIDLKVTALGPASALRKRASKPAWWRCKVSTRSKNSGRRSAARSCFTTVR